jgi:hypothetical protein
VFKGEFCWLKMRDGEAFGCLNARNSRNLKRLWGDSCVEMDCIVSASSLDISRSQWRQSGKSAELFVCFNIYGHEHAAQTVGDMLAATKMFLQFPAHDGRSLPYANPQYLNLPGVENITLDESPDSNLPNTTLKVREISTLDLEAVLDHIPQAKFLREHVASSRVRTPLKK